MLMKFLKKMKKVLFLMLFLMILGTAGFAQVRIGGNGVPHGSAVLDLNVNDATNNGTKTLALPRVSLASTTDKMGNAALLSGMLVYNTGGTLSEGVYYWAGSQWIKPNSTAYAGSTSVTLSGNSFQRAALTGDVTAAANANATTIGDGKVTNAKIAAAAIDSAKIASNAVKTVHINANAVTSAKIADATIVAADIANTTITGAKLANATVTATQLADGAVTSAKILDGTIATADLANSAVSTDKIAANAVTVAKLPAGATSSAYLRGDGAWATPPDNNTTYAGSTSVTLTSGAFQRAELTGDVTAATNSNTTSIANNAVTSAKIADGTIVTADLANNSITSEKIADGSITTSDLADASVSASKIAEGAVANAKLAAGAVSADKMSAMGAQTGDVLTFNGSTWSPSAVGGMGIAGGNARIGYMRVTYSGTPSVLLPYGCHLIASELSQAFPAIYSDTGGKRLLRTDIVTSIPTLTTTNLPQRFQCLWETCWVTDSGTGWYYTGSADVWVPVACM
jgi:hypothetical protein